MVSTARCFFCLWVVSLLSLTAFAAEEPQANSSLEVLKSSQELLTHSVFKRILPKENLLAAYKQAQDDDFSVAGENLFSSEMEALLAPAYEGDWFSGSPSLLSDYQGVLAAMKTMSPEDRGKLQSYWRSAFLDKLMSYVAYISSLQSPYSWMLMSQLEYNSNLNRVPEAVNPSALQASSGKDDFMHMALGNFAWKPFVNAKKGRDWSFKLGADAVHMFHFDHKENDAFIFNIKPKYSLNFKDSLLQNFYVQYGAQHFLYSGDSSSRNLSSSFFSNKLSTGWGFGAVQFKNSMLKSIDSQLTLSYDMKDYFNQSETGLDAKEFKWSFTEGFNFAVSEKQHRLALELSSARYRTASTVSGEYDDFQISLAHSHQQSWSVLDNAIMLSEKFSYRMKEWDQISAFGGQEEDLMTLGVQAATKWSKSTLVMLNVKNVWRSGHRKASAVAESLDADQFSIALGLSFLSK